MSTSAFDYEVAVKQSDETDPMPEITFTIRDPKGDQEVTAYRPTGGQVSLMMAAVSRGSSDHEIVGGYITLLTSMLGRQSAQYVEQRLLDREDPFDWEDIKNISDRLLKEFGGRPFESSSASVPSQQPAGQTSKPSTTRLI